MTEKKNESALIVEDDPRLARLLREEVAERGYAVDVAGTFGEGISSSMDAGYDLIISDLRLPDGSGLDLLKAVRERLEYPPAFIVITAFGTVSQAVEALKAGADDFLTKPLNLDHLAVCVERVLETRRLRREVSSLKNAVGRRDFHGLIGRSRAMEELYGQIGQIARGDGAVLVHGESGVGKELVARAIHLESGRADRPFLAVNCVGVPEELFESEFFGHVAGAFTGARRERKGLFREAQGGTLLLDEIGEMPLAIQGKLLRVLEERSVKPVGANRESAVDVRVIAATNRDLELEVREGRFREDLFYRLETFSLYVPPLRDRYEDIEVLAARFAGDCALRQERPVPSLSESALALLRDYPFPGNVRELKNLMERAVTFARGQEILPEHFSVRLTRRPEPLGRDEGVAHRPETEKDGLIRGDEPLPSLPELERRYIQYVLDRVGGNKRRAAALLGIGRKTLYRRLGAAEDDPLSEEGADSVRRR